MTVGAIAADKVKWQFFTKRKIFNFLMLLIIRSFVLGISGYLFNGSKNNGSRREKIKKTIAYCTYMECYSDKGITYDIKSLKTDLQLKLFG